MLYGNNCLEGIVFPKGKTSQDPEPQWQLDPSGFEEVKRQLDQYFKGRLKSFDLELKTGGTPFQQQVWEALAKIPYGSTISYGDLAVQIGNPKAVRAVGLANGRNPIPIIIPCHRVIGKNGSLTGFGGGLDVKRFLLELEQG